MAGGGPEIALLMAGFLVTKILAGIGSLIRLGRREHGEYQ
jgi:hypothetical protein